MNFLPKASYGYDELIACGQGKLFGDGNAQLPLPNMLMMDRITKIDKETGDFSQGIILAELDIKPELWFFGCHFQNDPVMPGCLGLDAMWQLLGFYLGWRGFAGRGRALSCGEVKFSGQILPSNNLVQYEIQIKKVVARTLTLGVADGTVRVDGEIIYQAKDLRVGLFNNHSLN